MSKNKEIKTNAMRILDRMKIPYSHYTYECEEFTDGVQVADLLGLPHEKVYKTLVVQGASREYFVFVIPIEAELDLKKAARAAGVRALTMLPQAKLFPLTGYRHGGCSPLGMKRRLPTFVDASAEALPRIFVSAGQIGLNVEVAPRALAALVPATFADVARRG